MRIKHRPTSRDEYADVCLSVCPLLGPVAPSSVNCTVSWLTDFMLLPLADDARELYLSGRRNRLTDG